MKENSITRVPACFRSVALLLFTVLGCMSMAVGAEVTIFTESFETDGSTATGNGRYQIENQSDDGNNDYFNRRALGSAGTRTRGGTVDGEWIFAARDLDGDGVEVGDLEDNEGRVTWVSVIPISGMGNFTYHAAVAAGGPNEQEFDNPIAFQYRIDGGEWLTAGGFRGLHTNSPSYIFTGGNFSRTQGTVPNFDDPRLTRTYRDWSWPIFGTGNTLQIRVFINANGGSEEYGFDNIRITAEDDVAFFTATLNQTVFTESDGDGAGELTIVLDDPAPEGGVSFTIDSSDTNNTEVNLPGAVFIGAGLDTSVVNFDILEDNRFDGNEPIILLISAPGYARERVLFTVNNEDEKPAVYINEVATVQIGANCADETDPLQDTNRDGVCLEDDEEFMEIINGDTHIVVVDEDSGLTAVEGLPVDISFWELWDERGTRHIFDDGTVLRPGQAAVVFGGGEARGNFGGSFAERNSQGNFSFDEDGESTSIRAGSANEAGAFVDEFTYTTDIGSTGRSFTRNEKFDAPGEFYVPAPDPTPENPDPVPARFVDHAAVPEANGAFFSPGLRVDGTTFEEFEDILIVEFEGGGDIAVAGHVVLHIDNDLGDGIVIQSSDFGIASAPDRLSPVPPGIEMAEDGSLDGVVRLDSGFTDHEGVFVTLSFGKNGDEATLGDVSFTITEGTSEASFTIDGVDDGLLDGDNEVSVWANADNMEPGVGYVTVTDIAEDTFSLTVNEVFGDVLGTDSDLNSNGIVEEPLEDQYIEIVNTSSTDTVNLTGWKLIVDRTNQPEPPITVHIFDGTILRPGGSVLVFGGGDERAMQRASAANYGGAIVHVANNSGSGVNLTDDGDGIVILQGPEGHTESVIEYDEDDHAQSNSAIVRVPELTGTEVDVHFDISLFLDITSPGTALNRNPFAGNGITSAQVLGESNAPLGDDWWFSTWLGFFNTRFEPWDYSLNHGFIYHDPASVTDDSLFFYDPNMDSWWFTNAGLYPFLYVFAPGPDNNSVDIDASWVFYFVTEGQETRVFGTLGQNPNVFLQYDPNN